MIVRTKMNIQRSAMPLFVALALLTWREAAEAKRAAPHPVPPVVLDGVRYTAPPWGIYHDKRRSGGYVEAWDVKTQKMLWDRIVYRVEYDPNLEPDVQDDFITQLRVEQGHLIALTEHAERFDMDLRTGRVRALTPLGPHVALAGPGLTPEFVGALPMRQVAAFPAAPRPLG